MYPYIIHSLTYVNTVSTRNIQEQDGIFQISPIDSDRLQLDFFATQLSLSMTSARPCGAGKVDTLTCFRIVEKELNEPLFSMPRVPSHQANHAYAKCMAPMSFLTNMFHPAQMRSICFHYSLHTILVVLEKGHRMMDA